MKDKIISTISPGEILIMDFLKPMRISQRHLAKEIKVPYKEINDIVRNRRPITAQMATKLGTYFKISNQFLINLQTRYDSKKPGGAVPIREAWVFKNPKVFASLRRGIKEIEDGKGEIVKDMDSFIKKL